VSRRSKVAAALQSEQTFPPLLIWPAWLRPRCWQPIRCRHTAASCPKTVTWRWGRRGSGRGRGRHWIPLCLPICIQLQLVLTWRLYNKQSAVQIKIMAITNAGLHILSAAKVRAESMKVPGWKLVEGIWSRGPLSPSPSLFIFSPSLPALCGSIRL